MRAGDPACPFCGAVLDATPARPHRAARAATRAAIFYAGVSLASAGCDCGPAAPPPEETIAQPYGAPPQPELTEPPPEETVAQPEREGPAIPGE